MSDRTSTDRHLFRCACCSEPTNLWGYHLSLAPARCTIDTSSPAVRGHRLSMFAR